MLNFFKKHTPALVGGEKLTDATLYKEVYSAQDELLKEANRILDAPSPYDKDEHERLKSLSRLGFYKAEQVRRFGEMEKLKDRQEHLRQVIGEYALIYPNNKFITIEAVQNICSKYGLLLGEVSDYIAEIPEKNQKELINFKFRESDHREPHEVSGSDMRFYSAYLYQRVDQKINKKKAPAWIRGKNLLVIAPEKKFDMQYKQKVGHTIQLKDPIVLQPVRDGYLIVSSWGLEASDPLVQNPKHN